MLHRVLERGEMINFSYCLQCGEKSDKSREFPFLCWMCCAMSDHWGRFFINTSKKIFAYVEEFHRKAHAAGTAKRLSIDELSNLFKEAGKATAGKERPIKKEEDK